MNSKMLKDLAEATGKSVDEILEYFGKKGRDAPATPMGSGKNLEALQRAKVGAPDMDAPTYPKNIGQDELAQRGDFQLVGEPTTKDFTMPHPEAQVPAIRTQTMPGVVPGASAKPDLPVPFKNVTEEQAKRMNPSLAKIAAGMGLVGGGAMLMGGNDEPKAAPLVPQVPLKAEEPKKPEELVAEAKKTVKTETPKPDGLDFDALSKKLDEEMAALPKEEEPDEFELARRRANETTTTALLGKAASQIGGGLASLGAGSQVKLDASGFDDLMKIADRPITQLQEKNKYAKAKAELADDKAMRDPNSEISKMVSGIAQQVGILKPGQTTSAMDLKNSGVNLGTLLATIEAGKARRDAAALAREGRLADREARSASKREEEEAKRTDKRKLITEEVEDRYRNLNDSLDQLDQLVKKYGTVEVFGSQNEDMRRLLDTVATDMAKYTDPNSVARPAEVALWRDNLIKTGLTSGGLGMSNQTARDIIKNFKGEVEKRRAHAYKVRGITPDNNPTPGTDENNNSKKQVVDKFYSPSRNQTKLIFSDGTEEIVDGKQ